MKRIILVKVDTPAEIYQVRKSVPLEKLVGGPLGRLSPKIPIGPPLTVFTNLEAIPKHLPANAQFGGVLAFGDFVIAKAEGDDYGSFTKKEARELLAYLQG